MFPQLNLNILDNGIESLHISMSIATNTRDVPILFYATEIFLLCIPLLQCKFLGVFYGTLHIDNPGRLLQTINIIDFKVKE